MRLRTAAALALQAVLVAGESGDPGSRSAPPTLSPSHVADLWPPLPPPKDLACLCPGRSRFNIWGQTNIEFCFDDRGHRLNIGSAKCRAQGLTWRPQTCADVVGAAQVSAGEVELCAGLAGGDYNRVSPWPEDTFTLHEQMQCCDHIPTGCLCPSGAYQLSQRLDRCLVSPEECHEDEPGMFCLESVFLNAYRAADMAAAESAVRHSAVFGVCGDPSVPYPLSWDFLYWDDYVRFEETLQRCCPPPPALLPVGTHDDSGMTVIFAAMIISLCVQNCVQTNRRARSLERRIRAHRLAAAQRPAEAPAADDASEESASAERGGDAQSDSSGEFTGESAALPVRRGATGAIASLLSLGRRAAGAGGARYERVRQESAWDDGAEGEGASATDGDLEMSAVASPIFEEEDVDVAPDARAVV